MVEVIKAVKPEDVGSRTRSLPFENSPNLFRIHFKTVSADDQAEELSLSDEELAFRQLSIEYRLLKALKDFTDVFFVFFSGFAIYQDVVEVCGAELIEVVAERVVNKPLKGSRGPS